MKCISGVDASGSCGRQTAGGSSGYVVKLGSPPARGRLGPQNWGDWRGMLSNWAPHRSEAGWGRRAEDPTGFVPVVKEFGDIEPNLVSLFLTTSQCSPTKERGTSPGRSGDAACEEIDDSKRQRLDRHVLKAGVGHHVQKFIGRRKGGDRFLEIAILLAAR